MAGILELAAERFAALPVETYQAGEIVLADGSGTGKLLVLKDGAVEVVKDGFRICEIRQPGALFGELAVLLDQRHTADVRALETSSFHVADAQAVVGLDPIAVLYVACIVAKRLDDANRTIIDLRRQLGVQERSGVD